MPLLSSPESHLKRSRFRRKGLIIWESNVNTVPRWCKPGPYFSHFSSQNSSSQTCHAWYNYPWYCDNADGCLDGELRADYSDRYWPHSNPDNRLQEECCITYYPSPPDSDTLRCGENGIKSCGGGYTGGYGHNHDQLSNLRGRRKRENPRELTWPTF